ESGRVIVVAERHLEGKPYRTSGARAPDHDAGPESVPASEGVIQAARHVDDGDGNGLDDGLRAARSGRGHGRRDENDRAAADSEDMAGAGCRLREGAHRVRSEAAGDTG